MNLILMLIAFIGMYSFVTWPIQTNATSKAAAENAANTFVPILWSDEVLVQREAKLYAAKFFKRYNHKGKPGDTIRVPLITRTTPNDKIATNPVTLVTQSEGKIDVLLNKWKELSRLFEDFLTIQSDYNLRSEYGKQDAYALAKQVDSDILALFPANLAAAYQVSGADGKTAYDATMNTVGDLTDVGIRNAMRALEDNDIDITECALFIPPSQKAALLGIDKFTLYQYYGQAVVQKGDWGEIYGVKVKVTTQMPSTTVSGNTVRVCVLAHPEAVCSAIQQDIRVQAQYKLEYLGWLVVSDMIYGVKALRVAADDVSTSNDRKSHAVALYTN